MNGLAIGLAAIASAALLSGCLVSDDPLFDATNAAATPIAPGLYDACSQTQVNGEVDCGVIAIEAAPDGAYLFNVEDDVIGARFHDFGGGDFAIQLKDDDDAGYQYYWGEIDGDVFTLVMMWCADLPRTLVDALVAEGGAAVDADYSTCTMMTPDAVVVAAKAYKAGEAKVDEVLRLTPSAGPAQE